MHSIDLCYGFFADEREDLNFKTEESIQINLLKISQNLFQNLIKSQNFYPKDTLFYLMKLNKQYSLFILDNYMLEESELAKEDIRISYLSDYEKLETIALTELEKKYQIQEFSNKYQKYVLTDRTPKIDKKIKNC